MARSTRDLIISLIQCQAPKAGLKHITRSSYMGNILMLIVWSYQFLITWIQVIWVLSAGFFSSGLLLRKMILIGANKDKERLDTSWYHIHGPGEQTPDPRFCSLIGTRLWSIAGPLPFWKFSQELDRFPEECTLLNISASNKWQASSCRILFLQVKTLCKAYFGSSSCQHRLWVQPAPYGLSLGEWLSVSWIDFEIHIH